MAVPESGGVDTVAVNGLIPVVLDRRALKGGRESERNGSSVNGDDGNVADHAEVWMYGEDIQVKVEERKLGKANKDFVGNLVEVEVLFSFAQQSFTSHRMGNFTISAP